MKQNIFIQNFVKVFLGCFLVFISLRVMAETIYFSMSIAPDGLTNLIFLISWLCCVVSGTIGLMLLGFTLKVDGIKWQKKQ